MGWRYAHPRDRASTSGYAGSLYYEERIVDAMAALLARDASGFDVLLTTNMAGPLAMPQHER